MYGVQNKYCQASDLLTCSILDLIIASQVYINMLMLMFMKYVTKYGHSPCQHVLQHERNVPKFICFVPNLGYMHCGNTT